METFRNLPDFYKPLRSLFRKNIYFYLFLSQHFLSFRRLLLNSAYNGRYNGRRDKKQRNKTKQSLKLTSSPQMGKETIQLLFELTAEVSAFAVLYLQNIYSIATLYVWKPHKHLHVWERQKKAMIAVGLLEGIWSISITVLICCELLQAVVGGWLLWDCLDECLDQSALLSPLMRSHCSSTRTHKPISAFQMSRGVFSHTHKREQGVQGAKTQTHIRKKT